MESTRKHSLKFNLQGTGTPVILVHSALTDSRSWAPILGLLSASHQVVTYDMAGFGASAGEPDDDHPAHLLDVLHRATTAPAHLIGNSAGGRVAASAALRSPRSILSLTVIGSVLCLDEPPPAKSLALGQQFFAARASGDLDLALAVAKELWIDEPGQLARAREVLDLQRAALPQFGSGELPLDLLSVPLHALVGSRDDAMLQAAALAASRRARWSRLTVVDGARHHAHEDAPAEVASALLAFLADVEQGRLSA
jgi:pimeloyl-ACP methyl ester carboxylesterase